jgi:hypothetical protein
VAGAEVQITIPIPRIRPRPRSKSPGTIKDTSSHLHLASGFYKKENLRRRTKKEEQP